MFEVMARKNKLKLAADVLPKISAERRLSGADIESIVLAAKRHALAAGRDELTRRRLATARWPSSSPRPRAWRRSCKRRRPCWNARR